MFQRRPVAPPTRAGYPIPAAPKRATGLRCFWDHRFLDGRRKLKGYVFQLSYRQRPDLLWGPVAVLTHEAFEAGNCKALGFKQSQVVKGQRIGIEFQLERLGRNSHSCYNVSECTPQGDTL